MGVGRLACCFLLLLLWLLVVPGLAATPAAPGGVQEPSLLRFDLLERQVWDELDAPGHPRSNPRAEWPELLLPGATPPHLQSLTGEDRQRRMRMRPSSHEDEAGWHLPAVSAAEPPAPTDPASPALNPWPAEVFDPGRYDLPITTNRLVLQYMRLFLGPGKAQFARWLSRSGRYADQILATAQLYGLPRDLLYVALVESGFASNAVSPSGAAGLWQFMRPTARVYGLRVDGWVDERFDPARATDAAMRHLRDLHDLYGSWELALAAYNGGIGRVGSAIARYNTNDFWTLARYRHLPQQTVHYVAKIMAAAIIGHHRAQFGFGGVALEEPPAAREIRPVPGLSLFALARRLGVKDAQLSELNPWLLRRAIPSGDSLPRLLVPATVSARAGLDDPLPDLRAGSGPPFVAHVVQLGDTLGELSRLYSVPAHVISELNQVPDDDDLLPGEQLLIPLGGTGSVRSSSRMKRVVVVPAIRFEYPDRKKVFFPIPRRGMDVAAIAATFGLDPSEIQLWNDLDPDAHLWPGMVLRLFVPKDATLPRAHILSEQSVEEVIVESRRFSEELRRLAPSFRVAPRPHPYLYHRVEPGETLESIAARYGIGVDLLTQHNGLQAGQLGQGQVLRIPRQPGPR